MEEAAPLNPRLQGAWAQLASPNHFGCRKRLNIALPTPPYPRPRRFSDPGAIVTAVPRSTSLTPGLATALANPHAAPQAGDGAAFSRSEVAERIRQSFDALVKASPIGVNMVRLLL